MILAKNIFEINKENLPEKSIKPLFIVNSSVKFVVILKSNVPFLKPLEGKP